MGREAYGEKIKRWKNIKRSKEGNRIQGKGTSGYAINTGRNKIKIKDNVIIWSCSLCPFASTHTKWKTLYIFERKNCTILSIICKTRVITDFTAPILQ